MPKQRYAGSYICQRDASKCKGYVNGAPCPILNRCRRAKDTTGQLERLWPMGNFGKLLIKYTPNWREENKKRRAEVIQAFAPEIPRGYSKKYREKNPEKHKESKKRSYEKTVVLPREALAEALRDIHESMGTFGTGARHLLLPCGEDCRNCPLPKGPAACPYTDADEDALMEREYGK